MGGLGLALARLGVFRADPEDALECDCIEIKAHYVNQITFMSFHTLFPFTVILQPCSYSRAVKLIVTESSMCDTGTATPTHIGNNSLDVKLKLLIGTELNRVKLGGYRW